MTAMPTPRDAMRIRTKAEQIADLEKLTADDLVIAEVYARRVLATVKHIKERLARIEELRREEQQ